MGGDVCTNAGDEARENVTNRMNTPTAPPRPHLGPLYSIGSHQLITNNLMNYKIIPMRCTYQGCEDKSQFLSIFSVKLFLFFVSSIVMKLRGDKSGFILISADKN